MIRHRRPSHEASQQRRQQADNHRNRRHSGKLFVNAGYEKCLSRIEASGCKHWFYSYTLKLPIGRAGIY